MAKLVKDRDALLAFYDFPAEHWKHIRTDVVARTQVVLVIGCSTSDLDT